MYMKAFKYLFESCFLFKIISWIMQNFFSIVLFSEVGLCWAYLHYLEELHIPNR